MNQKRVGEGLEITPLVFSEHEKCYVPERGYRIPYETELPQTAIEPISNSECVEYAPAKLSEDITFSFTTTCILGGIFTSIVTANPMFLMLSVLPFGKLLKKSKPAKESPQYGAQPKIPNNPYPNPKRVERSRTITYFHLEEKEVCHD
jgi:hypothetical protein